MAMTMGNSRIIWGFTFILILGCLSTTYSEMMGGITDVKIDEEIKNLGEFAVYEYNKQQHKTLTFADVAKAQAQVVNGVNYYLIVEAMDGEQPKLFAAIIYVKESKNLQEFKPIFSY